MTTALDRTRRLLNQTPHDPIPGQLDLEHPMTDHVQHTWHLSTPAGDEMTIDLWTDGYSVRVDGGPDDGADHEGGLRVIEQDLLPKYTAAGWRIDRDYAVTDPAVTEGDEELVADPEPDGRPDACPECGSAVEYQAEHADHGRSGPAWLCLGCRWGEWITP